VLRHTAVARRQGGPQASIKFDVADAAAVAAAGGELERAGVSLSGASAPKSQFCTPLLTREFALDAPACARPGLASTA
jgi:hypothetical protein